MRSSLKKIFAGVLVVAMLATTYSFDSLAVTLDTLVTKESTINQERNKNNQTKYFEQLLNEKNQLLMKGDEGDGSVLTTMPTDNQDDKNTDTTTQNKDVVITTMPSDDKISPDDFANEKTGDEVEAEEDDNKENENESTKTEDKAEQNKNDDNNEATKAEEEIKAEDNKENDKESTKAEEKAEQNKNDDLINDLINDLGTKIKINIDNDDIKDEKGFAVDNAALTVDKTSDDNIEVATNSDVYDTNNAVFGINPDDSDIYTNMQGFLFLDKRNNGRGVAITASYKDTHRDPQILRTKDANDSMSRMYTIKIDNTARDSLIRKVKAQVKTNNVYLDKNVQEYDDFVNNHPFSRLIQFVGGDFPIDEETGATNWQYERSGYSVYHLIGYDKNGESINKLEGSTEAVARAQVGMYLTKNGDNTVTMHFVQRTREFMEKYLCATSETTYGIPKYKVRIVFDDGMSSNVYWDLKGGTWVKETHKFDSYHESNGVFLSAFPQVGEVKKEKYTLDGWKMYKSAEDCSKDINATILESRGISSGQGGDVWISPIWKRSKLDVGDVVIFGEYYKYADVNGKYPLEWIVTEVNPDTNEAKLISKYAIDSIQCLWRDNQTFENYTETLVYSFLNTSFRDAAFNKEELDNIKVKVSSIGERKLLGKVPYVASERKYLDVSSYANKYIQEIVALPSFDEMYSFCYDYGLPKTDYAIAKGKNETRGGILCSGVNTEWTATPYHWTTDVHTQLECYPMGYTWSTKNVIIQDADGSTHRETIDDKILYCDYDGTMKLLVRPMIWVNMDYNFGSVEDAAAKQTKRVKIPTELIYRKDGYNTAAKAHVIRPQEAADFYQVLGLNKDEIGSINLGWAADHRPKEAYEIIDYYSDLRVNGNWNGQEKSLDPVEANTVNAALLYNDSSKKYDVYLFGMYALWRLDGQYYGIYWDLDSIADEIKQDTGIDIKKHESKVNWVIGDDAAWLRQKAKFDTYEEGTAHALPTGDDIAKAGYTLDGWYINSDKSTTYTSIPNTQTGEITLTAKWIEREYVDLPISMMKTKSGNGNIHITPNKTKWKSQLGLDGEKIESLTHGDLDTTGKTLVNTIKYKSTEFRELDSQQIIASAIRSEFSLDENAKVQFMQYSGNDSIRDFTTNQVYDASYDHIEKANIVAKVYKDSEGKVYVDLTEGSTSGAFQFYLPSLSAFYDRFPKLLWDLSDIDMNSQDSSTEEDEYQEGYDITWVLGDGKFKDEYKSYENALHKTTEDFILPGAETLDAPYRKILKEWIIGGVATTSISKDIHAPVTVVAVWTRSVGNFESYSIGKYKSSSIDTEEETALEWIILDKVDGKLLLTTKDIIDNKSYDTNGNAKFENSSISSWLNGEFYNQVFNDDQKVNILKEGKDKVFLLTEREAKDYFANDIQRTSKATDHAMHVDNGGENLDVKNGLAAYWLMTDADGNKAPYVTQNGIVNTEGIDVASKNIGVRPCIWVSETKISNIRSNPLNKLIDTINNQIEHFANFMNLFFGRKK